MSRHYTNLELETILEIGSFINCDLAGILPAPLLHLLYISVRSGPVSVEQVLLTVIAYRDYISRFLSACGDDELADVLDFIKKIDERSQMYTQEGADFMCALTARRVSGGIDISYPSDGIDVIRAWVARESVKRLLKNSEIT